MSVSLRPDAVAAAYRFAVGTLTVLPVRAPAADRTVAGRAMTAAPLVGAVLGLAAATVLAAAAALSGSALLAAVLAVGALAWLTRGLHLDGLADLADGLGSGKPAGPALDIMKRSDIGPFGVVTLVVALLVQVAALSSLPAPEAAAALVAACASGRLALTWACRAGVPAARPGGLGAFVAGTVGRGGAVAATAATAIVVGLLAPLAALGTGSVTSSVTGLVTAVPAGFGSAGPLALRAVAAGAAGLAAAWLLRRRAVRRLGGITGDVLGALVETAATTALAAFCLL
ncbi:adenosylcobinamide-GDP ribazoletransferase [Microbispora sp. RL4-1S]|uniref:Adenosylcobinamide-GDP ribazoletransferase n=1 Tax=Microbispora oryzae TaxID=2806554 RepID=A0A940WFZ7_9ACTN|nr:adenosylcobinamide-GDP ribazoletransferase [Microbispora oryzae]MBP2702502.1 adenosylcobinamide-GDP ribazoletransferase [Microbispora oryzae]